MYTDLYVCLPNVHLCILHTSLPVLKKTHLINLLQPKGQHVTSLERLNWDEAGKSLSINIAVEQTQEEIIPLH